MLAPIDWKEIPLHSSTVELFETVSGLPALHDAIQTHQRCPVRAAHQVAGVLARVIKANYIPAGLEESRFVWYAAGFIMGFAERWLQQSGQIAGTGIALLGEHALSWIAVMAAKTDAVAPRQGVNEYWLGNAANIASPTYTGSQGEHKFREHVHLVASATQRAVQLLRPFATGEVDLIDGRSALASAVLLACEMTDGLPGLVKAFDRESAEFSRDMRQYLANHPCPVQGGADGPDYASAYPVGKEMLPGPNAANIASVPMVDLILGNGDEKYRRMIENRYRWYRPAETAAMQLLLDDGRSLIDAVARTMRVETDVLKGWSTHQVADALILLPGEAIQSVTEVVKLARSFARWSVGHFRGAIRLHVVEAAKRVPADIASTLPVGFGKGVSGDALDHAEHIYNLRANGYLVTTLERAVRMATPAANDPQYGELVAQ